MSAKGQLSKEIRTPNQGYRMGTNGSIIVPVHKRAIIAHASGETGYELSIALREVPVPERRYVADTVNVDQRGDATRLMFGQLGLSSDKLRSLILVSVFPEPIRNLLKSSVDFLSRLRDFAKRNDIRPDVIRAFSDEPAQTVAMTANLIGITFSGREAEVDFFHIAPNALLKVQADVAVDPIVRIDLATSTLIALFERLVELESKLPAEVK